MVGEPAAGERFLFLVYIVKFLFLLIYFFYKIFFKEFYYKNFINYVNLLCGYLLKVKLFVFQTEAMGSNPIIRKILSL